jgi:hypothetical protein
MFNVFDGFRRIKKALGSGEENRRKGNTTQPISTLFIPGLIYEATVTKVVQPNNGVICSGSTGEATGLIPGMCIWAAGIMSDLFGFKMNYVPPAGSKVLVLVGNGGINYIVGGYLSELHGDYQGQQRSALGADEVKEGDAEEYAASQVFKATQDRHSFIQKGAGAALHNLGGHPAWDMTEGEVEITNALGVGATFLRHMAQLKGSELAKVECMLIDDMVRIISQTYKHFSAFGDFKIYNDSGRLNVQWDGTNSDWEISGKSELDDRGGAKKIEQVEDGEKQNMLKMSEQNSTKDAKWRFSHFVGFLGDFISTFVTDPAVWEASNGFLEQIERSGKFRLHVNEDGTGIISTVNEFIIEKTPRISVPLELKREYDPDGNNPILDEPEEFIDFLKTWDFEESGGVNNIHYTVYQIRDYAKWISNKYSKARFLQMNKDWRVPREDEVPEPDILGQKKGDKSKANKETNYSEGIISAYATIKIAKDGSIVLLDSHDNAVTLTKAGIQLSSHNNVQIESAGSINMVAGRDINLVAKNSVDITATQGGYSLRAETFMQNYCNKGGILFETNQSYDSPIFEVEDMPFTDQHDDSRIKGILLKTNGSSDIRLESGRTVGIKATQDALITARATCGISSSRAQINDTIEIFPKGAILEDKDEKGGLLDFADPLKQSLGFIKIEGILLSEKILANYLAQYAEDLRPMLCPDEDEDGHLLGEDRVIANQADVDAGDADNVGDWIGNEDAIACHPWHVLTQNKEKWKTKIEPTSATLYKNHISTAKFVHRDKTEYGTVGAGIGEGTSGIYQSLTQQALINDTQNTILNKVEYEEDTWLVYSPLGERGAAWPGTQEHLVYPTTKKLWEPDEIEPMAYMNRAEKLIKNPYHIKVIKT